MKNSFHPSGKPFENEPPSELQMRLYGQQSLFYNHLVVCSGNRRKPLGHPGCCCLNIIKRSLTEK